MSTKTLSELSEAMRDIDFAMFSTRTDNGELASRPMSNNREVEFKGDSFYFTYEQTRTVSDIAREPKVGLTFQGTKGLFGKPPLFIGVEGHAELIRDRVQFQEHWTSGLERWFPQGVDTPGMLLVKVHAVRIHYWEGEEDGDVRV